MISSDVRYFESGFLVLTTGTTGNVLLGLTDISITYSVETEELLVFDNNFSKLIAPTFKSWTASAGGVFTRLSGDTTHPQSGETRVTGGYGGDQLLELIKQRKTDLKAIFKLATGIYQTGNCLLTSYEVTSSAGQPLTFTLEITGTSDLTKSTT